MAQRTSNRTRNTQSNAASGQSGQAQGVNGDAVVDEGSDNLIEDRNVHLAETSSKRQVRSNLFASAAAGMSAAVAEKVTMSQEVRQRLAEANDLFKSGDDRAAEANEIAADAARRLYQGQIGGLITATEVSELLGDVFGRKPLKDGKPGKTPAGQGEGIRKRVVRAVAAHEYVENGDGGRFFEIDGTPDQVAAFEGLVTDTVAAFENGNITVWQLYDRLAEIKREHQTRTDAAFDPKRIAAIVASLSEDADRSRAVIADNPSLVSAYAALIDVLNVIGEEPSETEEG